jgi:hypothetical protein
MSLALATSFDTTLDRREAILERLLAIGQGLSGIASAWRNHGPAATGVLGVPRPAFFLFDGGTKLTQDVLAHKRPQMPPTIWAMRPQLAVLLVNRDTVENATVDMVPAPVGPEISSWFNAVNAAVTNDSVLTDLVTPNGALVLTSMETDLQIGRAVGALGAWLVLNYEFRYPFFPPRP